MEKTLAAITQFAARAHGEQLRKYEHEPYIEHPIRVMKMCRAYTDDIAILAAALLHDVLEDTAVPQEEIEHFLKDLLPENQAVKAMKLVVELTDVYTKRNYPRLNRRSRKEREFERLAGCTAEAQTIKYADVLDNALHIMEQDPDFGHVFLRESKSLLTKMDKGNPELLKSAMLVVDEGLTHERGIKKPMTKTP